MRRTKGRNVIRENTGFNTVFFLSVAKVRDYTFNIMSCVTNPLKDRPSAYAEAVDAYGAKKAYTGERRVAVIAYDNIGNRTSVTNSGDVTSYSPNNLNQYTQRQISEMINLRGSAETGATVTVKMGSSQSESVTRQNKYWHKQLTSTNDSEAQYPLIKVVGVAKNAATNGDDIVTIETGHVFVAKTPEEFTYDEDGNLLSDGRWEYTWNGENRPVSMETATNKVGTTVPVVRLEFVYDFQGRRVSKSVSQWVSNQWDEIETRENLFNGWDLLQELQSTDSGLQTNYYVHGLDLSGTLTGAGGIGGLVAAVFGTNSCYYTYCANGNVSELVDTDGNTKAHYEYSPYGKTLVASGALADENKFRFSTKPFEENTGLVLYEYRIYLPGLGRFGSKDPIGERGGLNLYVFGENRLVDVVDYLGLLECEWISLPKEHHASVEAYDTYDNQIDQEIDGSGQGMSVSATESGSSCSAEVSIVGNTCMASYPKRAKAKRLQLSAFQNGTLDVKGCCFSRTIQVEVTISIATTAPEARSNFHVGGSSQGVSTTAPLHGAFSDTKTETIIKTFNGVDTLYVRSWAGWDDFGRYSSSLGNQYSADVSVSISVSCSP